MAGSRASCGAGKGPSVTPWIFVRSGFRSTTADAFSSANERAPSPFRRRGVRPPVDGFPDPGKIVADTADAPPNLGRGRCLHQGLCLSSRTLRLSGATGGLPGQRALRAPGGEAETTPLPSSCGSQARASAPTSRLSRPEQQRKLPRDGTGEVRGFPGGDALGLDSDALALFMPVASSITRGDSGREEHRLPPVVWARQDFRRSR
jgi:hypothetical protein